MKKESVFILKGILNKEVELEKKKREEEARKKIIKKREDILKQIRKNKKLSEKEAYLNKGFRKKQERAEKRYSIIGFIKRRREKKQLRRLVPEPPRELIKKKKFSFLNFFKKKRQRKLKRRLEQDKINKVKEPKKKKKDFSFFRRGGKGELKRRLRKPKRNKLLRKNLQKKVVALIIIFFLVFFIVFVASVLLYSYYESPLRQLGVGADIQNATVSLDSQRVYIRLAGGSNLESITKIKFIFTDSGGNEYSYETTEGIEEIEVPFKRNFLDWILRKPAFAGVYDYEISAEEVGIENFDNIEEVSVIFEYEGKGEILETSPLDTKEPVSEKPVVSGGGGGGGSAGGGGGTAPALCVPSIDCSYYYNLNQCGIGLSDGCSNSLSCENCGAGYVCQDGSCIITVECSNKSDCDVYDGWVNASRLMDEQCQEINQSGQEDRDYFCNLTINICQHEVINETEWVNVSTDKPDGTACDDNFFCTENDSCDSGLCVGKKRDCSDEINCTGDFCNETTSICEHVSNNSYCELGEICSVEYGCVEGLCSQIFYCSDYFGSDNCTNDFCDIGECIWKSENCRDACGGADVSCGAEPFCQNCNLDDGCVFDQYRDFYCLNDLVGCNVSIDYCSDCSCDCGGYNVDESLENENCKDGLDNDCDNLTDKDIECASVDYISWWRFEEQSGGIVQDESQKNNVTLFGEATIINDSERGNVLRLDGDGDYAQSSLVVPREGTISFWFNPNFNGDSLEEAVLVDARDSVRWWTIGIGGYLGDNQLSFSCEDVEDHNYFANFGFEGYVFRGDWHHVVGTWKIGEPIKLYFDGALRGESSNNLESFDADNKMRIGYPLTPSYPYPVVGYFNGSVDDVMVFNRSLSEEEVLQIYNVQNRFEVSELNLLSSFVELVKRIFKFLDFS